VQTSVAGGLQNLLGDLVTGIQTLQSVAGVSMEELGRLQKQVAEFKNQVAHMENARREEREQKNAVIESLKRQCAGLELELETTQRKLRVSQPAADYWRSQFENLADSHHALQSTVEKQQAKLNWMKVEPETDKRLVPEYLFCPECDEPHRYWDGSRFRCWRCG
jgi:chromosome segregation ATPase